MPTDIVITALLLLSNYYCGV